MYPDMISYSTPQSLVLPLGLEELLKCTVMCSCPTHHSRTHCIKDVGNCSHLSVDPDFLRFQASRALTEAMGSASDCLSASHMCLSVGLPERP